MQLRLLRRWRFGLLLVVPVAIAFFPPPAAAQTVTYQVKFEGNWTLASTPGGVVGGAHFTTLIGGVHGSGVTFWAAGEQASAGVELVAELGSTPTFRSEVQASSHTLSVIQEGVAGGGTGSATFNIDVTRTHPLVTLLSMIGPSPDWFVGVSGVSLLDGSNQWRQSHVVDLFPYDAGTEDGTEFTLSNDDTDPQGVITRIAGTGKFSNVRMARLTFTRTTPPPPPPTPSVSLSASPNPVDEGQPVTVTAQLSEVLSNSVTIPLELTAGSAEAGDFGALASITISGGRTTGTGTIPTVDDADTDDETFTISLGTLPADVTAGNPSSVEVTIRDGDSPPPPPSNDPPTVQATCQPCTVPRGGEVQLRADASDPDGDPISYGWGAAQGTFTGATDGQDARWTAPGLIGTFVIRVEVADGRGGTAAAEVEVDVVNRPPVFGLPLRFELAESRDGRVTPVTLGVIPVTDPDGDDFELGLASGSDRFVIGAATGTLSYAGPGEDFETGPNRYVLTVMATDTLGGDARAEVVVNVIDGNENPVATDDALSVAEDREARADVLANDYDPDRGDRIRVISVGAPGHGRAQVVDGGAAVHYAPDPNYHGPDRFTYVIADPGGLADSATVEVTVTPVDDAPEATDDQATTREDEAAEIPVLHNDTDPDGDRLRLQSVSTARHGTAGVAADGETATYTPDLNYHGPDRFTYVVADAGGLTDTATVEVTVTPVNDAPEAADDRATTPEDEAVEIPVLDNDTDLDGDRLRVRSVSPARHGTAEVAADGANVTYVPDPNYHGADRFAYVVADADGLADTATVEVTVTPVNDAPEAADDRATTREDEAVEIPVLDNDADLDGDRLRVQSVSPAGHGTAEVAADGTNITYTPDANYHGPDRFTYVVADAGGLADTAAVEVTVTPVNDAPEAADDQATTREDEAVEIPVLDNDTDLDGDRLRVRGVSPAGHGTAVVAADGTNVTYTPAANYHGPDRFTYVVADADGLADTATVAVTVTPVNDGPEAVGAIPDQMLDEGGDGVTVDLTPFFTDIDGDPMAFSAETSNADVVTAAVSGTGLVLLPVVYGDATVIVTATDPGGLAATQRVTVGVSDGTARAVLSDAFAAMARSYLSSARMTLERRAAPGARSGRSDAGRQSGLRVGGRPVALPDGHSLWDAAKQLVAGWLPDPAGMSALGAQRLAPYTEFTLSDLAVPAGANPLAHLRPSAGISGTDFTLGWGGQTAGSARPGVAWSLWGQTDVQRYDGGDAELGSGLAGISGDYDGDLRVSYLGLDAELRSWLFGVALGSSRGAGNWNAGTASGRLSTSVTSVHPYLRWSSGATSVWTTFGAGRGEARNERTATGRGGESPLDLTIGLVDFQRRLGPSGGPVAFGLRADAGWADLSTREGTETIDGLRARVHQARLGLDVRSEMRFGGAGLAPFGAVHLRNDGGDGRTGSGVELSGGLHARIGFVGLDAQGRWLAYHSATRYGESGAALTLALGGRAEEGFSLSASPRWGGETRGGYVLWQDRAPGMTSGPDALPAGWTMDVRGAYRARLGGRLLEIATVYDHAIGGQRLQLTGQIGLGADRR
ncbi:MAG: Ig-like domain-containing protein [Gemmatimonadota bacterium]|nr:Ig-like domain-containing protein [Gemmatimonadota bacterium]